MLTRRLRASNVIALLAAVMVALSSHRAATQGAWVTLTPDPNAKVTPAVVAIDGKLYVHGFDQNAFGNQGSFAPRLSIYDPASNSWTTGASPSHIRAFASAAAIDGKMFVVGGCVMSDCRIGVTSALEIYDPATNTWSSGAPMPTARFGMAAGVIGGKLYVTAGTTACPPCSTTSAMEIYDPVTNAWTTGAAIPNTRELAASAVVNGLLHVIGGYERGSVNAAVGAVHVYDPVANTWSTRASVPTARLGAAAGVLNGQIYVVGGSTGSSDLVVNESYDPASNTWTPQPSMATARRYTAGGVVGPTLYVIDGANATQLATNEAFTPTDQTAPVTSAAPSLPPNGNGWNNTAVMVTLHASDEAGGSGVQSISYSLSGAQSGSGTIAGDTGVITILNEGATTVTYHASDVAGNAEANQTLTIRIDTKVPIVSTILNQIAQATTSAGALVTFSVPASDTISGVASISALPRASGMTFPLGTTHETVTVLDMAGNSTVVGFDVTVVPSRPVLNLSGGTYVADGNPHSAIATVKDVFGTPVAGNVSVMYMPGGMFAPVSAGRYSATVSFASNDPAFTSVFPWIMMAPDPHAKVVPAVAEINGILYVHGFDQDAFGNQGSFIPRLSLYNPGTNTWTVGASPGLIRSFVSVGVINGKLYVAGGCVMSDCRIGTTNALEIYDPVANSWSNGPAMPTARFGAAAGVIGGKLYVTGGTTACPPCDVTNVTEIYDPSTNTWTTGAPIPATRELAASAVVNGRLYVIGGYERGAVNAPVSRVDIYNPSANSWTSGSPMPIARFGAAAGLINGQIYVAGGNGGTHLTANESYDPETDTWTEQAPMSVARTYVSGGVVNSKLYVLDGTNGAQSSTNEMYDPSLATVITILPGDVTPPTTSVNAPAPNVNGWNRFNVFVSLNAMDNQGGSGVQSISYTLSGAQTGSNTLIGNFTSFTIFNEGITTVTYHATDNAGNVEPDHTLVFRLDKTQPLIPSLSNQTLNATSTAGALVSFNVLPSDATSGIDTAVFSPLASGATFPHGTTNETLTVVDRAGNTATRFFNVTVNKTLLSIAVSPSTASLNVGESRQFQAMGHFTNGPDLILMGGSGGSGGSGGGGSAPSGLKWQGHFTPVLNVTACSPSPGFNSMGFTPDPAGNVHTSWGGPTPLVQVDGVVTLSQVNLTVTCLPANGSTGSIVANWTGTRYEGTATMSGTTSAVTFTGWSSKAAMPAARFSLGAASMNGRVYVFGGATPGALLDAVDAYDPATDTWTTGLVPMPTPREGHRAVALNNLIYVVGGHSAGGVASGVIEAYNPAANVWITGLAPMPTPRSQLALVATGGKLYALGGDTGSSNSAATAAVESYDPSTNQWTTLAPLPTPRSALVAGVLDNGTTIVAAGGTINGGPSAVTGIYTIASNSWGPTGPSMLVNTSGAAAVVVNNALFVFGGSSPSMVEMYRPAGNSQPAGWATLAAMPTGRGQLAVAAVGEVVYAIGGQQSGQASGLSTVEAFSTPPPFDFSVTSGSGGGGSGGSGSIPTVQWQSGDTSVAGINQFGSATGNGPGQATIIATANGISCATTATCGAVTVSNPGRITLTLAPGSVPFASVLVTPTNLATGQSEGTFAVPIDEPQSVGPAQFHIEFTAPDGYTVTPTQVDVSIGSGDDAIVPLLFALIDTVPPVLAVPADVIAEATSPSGTAVSFAAPTATDSGSGVQSVGCDRVSGGPFLLGTTTVHCAATDNAGNAATASFTVTVKDTKPPTIFGLSSRTVEAIGPAGAVVTFNSAALDAVSGQLPVSCDRPSGSMFPLFTTFVTCSAVDAAGNKAFFSFSIFVRDSIAPVARVVSPSPDALIPTAPSTVSVDVEVIEAIGVSRVFINNVNAVMVGTTGQGTLWRASLSVPAGTALSIMPMAFDLFNNQSFPNPTFVDNDGIPADLDRSRQTGADISRVYSNDFVDVTPNGIITSGTIARDGNSKVVAVKRNGGVGLTLVTPGRATITACAGTTKSFVLDTPNEGVDVTCSGTTINVRAYTPNAVEVSKQMSETRYETRTYCRWVRTGFFGGGYNACYQEQVPFTYTYVYQFALRNGQGASTGSPVTAAADNTEPIHVDILQVDDLGVEFHAGSFDLDPGESADVAVTSGVDRQDRIEFSVLQGTVTATIGGVAQTVGQGQHATAVPDRVGPGVTISSPMPNPMLELPIPVTVMFSEPVTGFTADVVVATNATVVGFAGGGSIYTFMLVPNGLGASTAAIPVGSVVDAASNGNLESAALTRTVLSPQQLVSYLTEKISALGAKGIALLLNVLQSLAKGNTGAACNQLAAVISQAQVQPGKSLTPAQAATLIELATDARGALGCR